MPGRWKLRLAQKGKTGSPYSTIPRSPKRWLLFWCSISPGSGRPPQPNGHLGIFFRGDVDCCFLFCLHPFCYSQAAQTFGSAKGFHQQHDARIQDPPFYHCLVDGSIKRPCDCPPPRTPVELCHHHRESKPTT